MNKRLASALSAAALGWLGGLAGAQTAPAQPAMPSAATPTPATMVGGYGSHNWQPNDCCRQDNCCDSGRSLYASLEGLYLKPRWDNSSAFSTNVITIDLNAGLFLNSETATTNFNPEGRTIPRITVGFGSSEGMGARLRWMHGTWGNTLVAVDNAGLAINTGFDGNITTTPALGVGFTTTGTAANPSAFAVVGNLELTVVDFEGTTNLKFKNVELGFSGGVRYLHASQGYNAFEVNNAPDGLVQPSAQILISGHSVNVIGPSAGIEGRIPVGDSGMALYSLSRGSLLFGEGKQIAAYAQSPQDGSVGLAGALNSGASQVRDTVLPTLDIEFGGEYSREMGNSLFFTKLSLVGQLYYNLVLSARVGNAVDSKNYSMSLWGVAMGAGIRY